MKVSELIEQLQSLNPELDVYVSSDSEGNSFHRCGGAWEYFTDSDSGSYGLDTIYTDESDLEGEDIENFRKVAIVWP